MMFYLKIATIYAILYSLTTSLILLSGQKNPAISFFLPSIISMMIYARQRLNNTKVNTTKHALACGLVFGIAATLFSWLVDLKYGWIARPQIMYLICFAGNFFFPLMVFGKAQKAQNG